MEREEAIKVLNTYDVNFDEYRAEEIADAIDMAIEALSAEPNEDLVQRSDVLEIISEAQDGSGSTYEILQPIFEKVNGMPSCHRCYECDEALLNNIEDCSCGSHFTSASREGKAEASTLSSEREDLISRQAAINSLDDGLYLEDIEQRIKDLPSADAVDVAHDIPEYCSWSQTYTNMVQSAMYKASADAVSREDTVTLNSPISIQAEMVAVVRCKDCRHGEHIQIPLWENRDIDKAPSQFHDFIKCHKFHIKGFNETLYLGDDDFCSHGEREKQWIESKIRR